MALNRYKLLLNLYCIIPVVVMAACQRSDDTLEETVGDSVPQDEVLVEDSDSNSIEEDTDTSIVHSIDLSNWKVTLPIGGPIEVAPPEILDYANNQVLKEFMYDDTTDGSLVFYTYPGSSTANSSYSRTELREQMVSGSNSDNWTFEEGGRMKGTLSVPFISKNANNEYHRTIVMQIHGRLTNEQKNRIGASDNNAPPILKIYWQKGKIRMLTKKLKDADTLGDKILATDAWQDDEAFIFEEMVNHEKFSLEIIASKDRLEVVLNDNESKVYNDMNIEKWGIFENYFKAGNYLQSTDVGSSALVKYYDLKVNH